MIQSSTPLAQIPSDLRRTNEPLTKPGTFVGSRFTQLAKVGGGHALSTLAVVDPAPQDILLSVIVFFVG